MSAIERSAVFMVQMNSRFLGSRNGAPPYWSRISSSRYSSRKYSSPNTLATLPRFNSSMTST